MQHIHCDICKEEVCSVEELHKGNKCSYSVIVVKNSEHGQSDNFYRDLCKTCYEKVLWDINRLKKEGEVK